MIFSSKKRKIKEILENCQKEGKAIGQFNFSSIEQLQGILLAAKETQTPVICGTSQGEADFFGMKEAVAFLKIAREREGVEAFLNLDHGRDLETIKKAIDAGYDMVHFDGSRLPFEENMRLAKEVVSCARKRGVFVEGEVSQIKGRSVVSDEKIEEFSLTSVEKVAKFIEGAGIDSVAFDVGSVHGIHRESPEIKTGRVAELLRIVSCLPVLHGGSGISEEKIKELVSSGVVKININTELRLVWHNTLLEKMKQDEREIVPYKLLPFARDAVCRKVKEKIRIFNNDQ